MKNINKIKRIIGIIICALIVVIGIYLVFVILPNKSKNIAPKEIEKIKFDYILYQRDNPIYKDIFNELKMELNNENIDYKKYAELISKLFIVDFYTLSNKTSKEDVGGVQFVKGEIKDNFILNSQNTIYKYIGISSEENPEVNNIELVNISEYNYKIEDKEYEGYEVKLKWEYKNDLGYDKEGTIYVIKEGEKLVIVEKNRL